MSRFQTRKEIPHDGVPGTQADLFSACWTPPQSSASWGEEDEGWESACPSLTPWFPERWSWSSEVSRCPAVLSPAAERNLLCAQLNFEATRVAHELDGERL